MRSKCKTHHILEVVLLSLLVSGCRNALPDSTSAQQSTVGSTVSRPKIQPIAMDAICDLTFTGETEGDNQWATATGDINNDNYDDLIISATFCNNEQGRVYLYYGGPEGLDNTPDVIFNGEPGTSDRFGTGLSCGDVDNDKYDDILVGAWKHNNRQGRVYLFYGDSKANMDAVADVTFDGETAGSDFGGGWDHIIVEDIDGDNYDDIVIPAVQYNNGQGRAYLYLGDTKEKMDAQAELILTGENEGDWFGDPPGGSFGNFNNDGYDDLAIGARKWQSSSEHGRVYLYYGRPDK